MSKYIDAEKLKAEIKRQKHGLELSIQSQGDYGQSCHIVAYDNILSLIDSLQQEQPEVDLAEEIKNYFKGFYMDLTDQGYILKNSDGPVGLMSVKDIARHFYELGVKARKQEKK